VVEGKVKNAKKQPLLERDGKERWFLN